jgi:hypothetical protein
VKGRKVKFKELVKALDFAFLLKTTITMAERFAKFYNMDLRP